MWKDILYFAVTAVFCLVAGIIAISLIIVFVKGMKERAEKKEAERRAQLSPEENAEEVEKAEENSRNASYW